jgi:hypothetical protein
VKKNCSHSERGFLDFDKALAKEQVPKTLSLSRNEVKTQKDRSSVTLSKGCNFSENALK